MLTAEENVVLPLSIAGEKPDKAWLDELLARSGLTTARDAPPGRALGRPAAAGRDRPRTRLAPAIVFADEPTGNLDSKTSGEILELMRESVDELRADDGDGDARPAGGRRSPTACSSSPTA